MQNIIKPPEVSEANLLSRTRRIISILVLLAIIIAGLYYFYGRQGRRRQELFGQTVQRGKEALRRADAQSLRELEAAVKLAPNSDQEAIAKINLGLAQTIFNPTAGIATLKNVAATESYPFYHRAGAIIRILRIYSLSRDEAIAKAQIFTDGEPWDSFIKDRSVEEAVRLAYEWTNQIFPTATANYFIALWYGERLFEDTQAQPRVLDVKTREAYKREFHERLTKGDELIAGALASVFLEEWEKASLLDLRATAYLFAYALDKNEEDRKTAEESFEQAIAILQSLPDIYAAAYHEGLIRFFNYDYALFLAYRTRVEKENFSAKVRELLNPIIEAKDKNLNFFTFLRNVAVLPSGHALHQLTLFVADIDPRFKDLLKELGWSI